MIQSTFVRGLLWGLLAAGCSSCGSTPADPPKTPLPSTLSNASIPDQPARAPFELVPARVRNSYLSKSDPGAVDFKRDAGGWTISLQAPPSAVPDHGEWAGFCWDLSPVDASAYTTLVLEIPEVPQEGEVDIKLERSDNHIQDVSQQYLKKGSLEIDLTNFSRVKSELARLCIMAIGRPTAKTPTKAKFVLARALLR